MTMQKHRMSRISFVVLLAISLLAMNLTSAKAAGGTAGTVEWSSNTYLANSLVSIHCEGLTVSADFTLSFTAGGPSNITFTTSASQKTFDITLAIAAPTAGVAMVVDLSGGALQSVDLDAATIISQEITDLLPTDLIIDVGIQVMIILIIVGIVAGLAIVGKRRLG